MIDLVVLPRKGGKTAKVVEWLLAEEPGEFRVVLCLDESEAHRVAMEYLIATMPDEAEGWLHEAPKRHPVEQDKLRFLTVSRLRDEVLRGRRGVVMAIDNLDMLIRQLVMCDVGLVTWTGDGPAS